MHAGATPRRRPRTGVGAPRPSGIGLGEPGPSAAADGDETFREPPAPRTWRPTVLDRLGASLAELAHGVGGRAAGHRCPVASRLAPAPMDPTFEGPTGRPSTSGSTDPRSRPRHGDGEPAVGRTPNSWRAPHARSRRLGTHGVASAGTVPTSVFSNVEDISHESPRVSRVDGFLHRADAHGPRAVRTDRARASSPAHRASQHHGSSDSRLVRSTSGRCISGRHGAPLDATEIETAFMATSSSADWPAWASPKSSQRQRVPGRIRTLRD